MKKMKRIAAMVLAIAMLMSCLVVNAFAALTVKGTMTWNITNEEKTFIIGTDEYVELAIENTDETGMIGLIFNVYCDTDVFTLADFDLGTKYKGKGSGYDFEALPAESEKEGYRVVWYKGSNTDITAKEVGTLLLEVDSNAVNGDYDFELECVEVGNVAEEKFAVSFSAKQTLKIEGGVDLSAYKPTVKTQPTNGTYTYKTDAADALTAEFAVGTQGTVTTQWYKCDADGKNATKVGAAGSALTASYVPALPAVGTTEYYYCEITNKYSEEYSFTAKTNVVSVSYELGNPVKELLDISIPSSGNYTGTAYTATVTAKEGVEGLGTITVKYNGKTEAPKNANIYTVTVDIAAGSNYKAVTGLEVGTFTIRKVQVQIPSVTNYTYAKDTERTGVKPGDHYNLTGTYQATNVGEYTVTAALNDKTNYVWADGTSADKTLKWTISAFEVTAPTLAASTFTYDGSEKVALAAAADALYTVTEGSATNAGSYTAVASLKDKTNYVWSTGNSDDLSFDWTIEKASVALPTAATGLEYTGSAQTGVKATENTYTVENGTKTDAGEYKAIAKLADPANYQWKGLNTSADQEISWSIARAKVEKPTASTGLKYSGTEQTAVAAVEGKYTVENGAKTNAGSYTAVVTLNKNYQWADGTTTALSLPWSIAKADATITASDITVVLGYTGNVNASIAGVIPADLTDAELTYVIAPADKGVTIDQNGEVTVDANATEGTYTVTISFVGDDNYNAAEEEVTVTVTDKMPVDVILNGTGKDDAVYGNTYSVADFVDSFTIKDFDCDANGIAPDATFTWTLTYPDGSKATDEIVNLAELPLTEAGEYTLTLKYECAKHVGEASVTFTIARLGVDKPVAASDLVYNGSEQTGVAAGTGYTVKDGAKTNAGNYVATVKLDSNHCWKGETGEAAVADLEIEWSIAKAEINVSGYTWNYSNPFEYNGSVKTVLLNEGVDSKLTISYFENAKTDAGTYNATATAVVKAEYADNYQVKGSIPGCEWKIEPKTVDVSGVKFEQSDIIYNGEAHTVAVSDLPTEGVTVSYTGTTSAVNAGTYTATATLAAANGNYTLSGAATLNLTWKIVKAELDDIVLDAQYKYTKTGEESLTFALPSDTGAVTFAPESVNDVKGILSAISVEGQTVTYTLSGAAAAGDTASYVFTVSSENYEDITLTVNVTLTDRESPEVSVNPIVVTYSGNPITADTVKANASSGVPGTWSIVTDMTDKVNAGEYTIIVKFTPNDSVNYAEVTVENVKLTIKKAVPTVTPGYKHVSSGKTLADAELTIKSSSVPGTIAWELSADTKVQEGKKYVWIFTPEDTTNYETVTGELDVAERGEVIMPPVQTGPSYWTNPYSDVEAGTWYFEGVKFVDSKGLMNGVGGGKFAPGGTVTRATMMTILARMNGVDTSVGSTWYEVGMKWAVSTGVSDGTNPGANITREQIVTMLWRSIGSPDYTYVPHNAFVDGDEVSSWAVKAMDWAVGTGILGGKDGNRLDPTGTATRAELAVILARFSGAIG